MARTAAECIIKPSGVVQHLDHFKRSTQEHSRLCTVRPSTASNRTPKPLQRPHAAQTTSCTQSFKQAWMPVLTRSALCEATMLTARFAQTRALLSRPQLSPCLQSMICQITHTSNGVVSRQLHCRKLDDSAAMQDTSMDTWRHIVVSSGRWAAFT